MKQKPASTAFSLIKISIVALIIGILIAGVTQISSLVRKFKVQSAKSPTRSSPVNSTKNLVAFYETSLDESFIRSEAVELQLLNGKISLPRHLAT